MRLTEEEAKALGFVKDKDGNWHQRKTAVPRRDTGKVSQLESDSRNAVEKKVAVQSGDERGGKQGNGARLRIVVTAYYRRHVDPDNLCPKWFVDRLKEHGIIPDDSSEHVAEFVKRVVRVENWEPEITKIEVWEI